MRAQAPRGAWVADSRSNRSNRSAGFSLVEILVTVAIMGLMLTAVTQMLTSVRFTRDIIHNEQEQYLAGPAILDQLERDLMAIFVTNLPRATHLKVENKVVGGTDADRIDFFATTDNLIWQEAGRDRMVRADLNEVGYCLRPNPDNDDFLQLYRREGFGIDTEPHSEGRYVFLHDRVRLFNIEVFPERGPEDQLDPLEDWGMDESDPDTQGLPAFLRVTLEIELEPRLLRETMLRAKQLKTYTRIINLPENLRYADEGDIPRFVIPGGDGGAGDEAVGPGGEDTELGGGGGGGLGGGRGGTGGRGETGGGDTIQGERTQGGG